MSPRCSYLPASAEMALGRISDPSDMPTAHYKPKRRPRRVPPTPRGDGPLPTGLNSKTRPRSRFGTSGIEIRMPMQVWGAFDASPESLGVVGRRALLGAEFRQVFLVQVPGPSVPAAPGLCLDHQHR